MTGLKRQLFWLPAIALIAAGGVTVWAAGDTTTAGRVLHEDLPATSRGGDSRMLGPVPDRGQNPDAIESSGALIAKPKDAVTRKPNERRLTSDPRTSVTPDAQTGADNTLHYDAVFNPSIVPFKRMDVYDTITSDFELSARATPSEPVDIAAQPLADHDLFWGSIFIRLETGRAVALPSVAAEMTILSYETEPQNVSLTFTRDPAGNFYVRTDDGGVGGDYRVKFLVQAPADYFGTGLPTRYRVHAVRHQPGAPQMPGLPVAVQRQAERALDRLGVDRGDRLDLAINTLVEYFRGFEAKTPPTPSGRGIYWDLFINQAGVCRHRSYAFMITANALGIPTRYITNEAHAFVEVWLPEVNWLRIDLGGAALQMDVSNGDDKVLHRPRQDDTLARPRNYDDSYTQLNGGGTQIRGLSRAQIDAKRRGAPPLPADSGTGDPTTMPSPSPTPPPTAARPDWSSNTATPPQKTEILTVISEIAGSRFRGEELILRGRITEADDRTAGVEGLRVDLYLAEQDPKLTPQDARLVGHATTGPDGQFEARFVLPQDLPLKSLRAFAWTSGNTKFAKSRSH